MKGYMLSDSADYYSFSGNAHESFSSKIVYFPLY